jgi:hypothetical protein
MFFVTARDHVMGRLFALNAMPAGAKLILYYLQCYEAWNWESYNYIGSPLKVDPFKII